MAGKTKQRQAGEVAGAETFVCRMAYQLGGQPSYFRTSAEASWSSAEEGDPCPPSIRGWCAQLRDVVGRLTPPGAGLPAVERAERVRRLAGELALAYEARWGGPEHREWVACRDGGEPGPMTAADDSVLARAWADLLPAVDAFSAALPPQTLPWMRLGSLVAEFLNSPVGGPEAVEVLPVLENQLAEMDGHPLLRGVPLSLTTEAYLRERVGRNVTQARWLRQRVLAIHGGITAGGAPAGPVPGREGAKGSAGNDRSRPARKASLALALLVEHPDWTDVRIAEVAGCDRSTLHRSRAFQAARAAIRSEKSRLPRGSKAAGRGGAVSLDGARPDGG